MTMALVEVEMVSNRFGSLVQTLASAAPIPIGTLGALGPGRLISAFAWDSVEIGPSPSGFTAPAGALTARAALRLRHVSTAELDANANATGTEVGAEGWLSISANASELRIDLIGVDVVGGAPQLLSPAVQVARRPVDEVADAGTFVAAAVLARDGVVTLRFATATSDALLAAPLNLVSPSGDDWAIRVSGEIWAQQLLTSLTNGVTPPPGGSIIEEQPTASWMQVGEWYAFGSVGLEKKDACPGALGLVDISVTVNVLMKLMPDVTVTPPMLNLQAFVGCNVSDWDDFRCWLGSGGFGSMLLDAINGPITGFVGSIGSLIAVGEILRLNAVSEVADTPLGGPLTQVSSDDTSVTYAGARPLPTLATSIGTTNAATVGPFGLVVTGNISFFPAQHKVTFNPDGGELTATLSTSFNCDKRTWKESVNVQSVHISDHAQVSTIDLGAVPVRVFSTSSAVPPQLWSIKHQGPAASQTVTIAGSEGVRGGDSGRIYLHTSAGIRRYDIPALVSPPTPTVEQQVEAISRCLRFARTFSRWEQIQWLIDPPPFDYGFPALRQWLFTFAEIPASTRLTFHHYQNGQRVGEPLSLVAGRSGEGAFEIVTDAATDIVVEHSAESIPRGRVNQRWLLPIQVVAIGRVPTAILRSGSTVVAGGDGQVLTLNLESGSMSRRAGELELSRPAEGLMATKARRFIVGGHREIGSHPSASQASRPFSITLRDGKIAAAFEDKLVIAVPWGTVGIEPPRKS
jgi:hypothetical protein